MHIFPYSARQGTAAARFSGQIPESERKRRVHRLTDLDARLGHQVHASFVGQVRPVLWENAAAETPRGLSEAASGDTRQVTWSGLTDNYLRVRMTLDAGVDLHNRITSTHLVGLDGDDLLGALI